MARFSLRSAPRNATERTVSAMRRSMLAERIAQAFWPVLTVLCLVLALPLLGFYELMPRAAHVWLVGASVLALVAAIGLGIWRFRWPRPAEARARLDATLPERPLAALDDRQATGQDDAWAAAVWRAHQRRAEEAARRLRAAGPDLRLARFDGWALRLFAPILLIAALIGARGDWQDRLELLLLPAPPVLAGGDGTPYAAVAQAEAWATPPAYTGLATVYLDRETPDYTLSEGSLVTVRVTDLDEAPEIEAPGIDAPAGFASLGAGLWELRGTLTASGPIRVTGDGEVLAGWEVRMTPDNPPSISLSGMPRATMAGAMELSFEAEDDFGVASAWAEIVPPGGPVEEGKGLVDEPVSFALPLPVAGDPRKVADTAIHDLSAHPLAGGEAVLSLHAEDGAGQHTSTDPVTITVPGRRFTHPLAKALVEQRRALALDFATAPRVLDVVQSVTRFPDEVFDGNHGAYLAVRTAVRRLAHAIPSGAVPQAAEDVTELLWQAALALDGGDLHSALEKLRAAEQALRDALENGTEEDIARAMEDLRAAMDQYLQEMARQAMERGMDPNAPQQPQQGQELTRQDLNEMLDEMQRRAESGLRDQARDMLSELSRMLENLQMGQMQPGQQQGEGSPGQQAMRELQDLIDRQRELSDRTFGEARRQQREGQAGQQPGQQGQQGQGQQEGQGQGQQGQGQQGQGGLSSEQQALRSRLNELLGQLPGGEGADAMRRALEDADGAMGQARDDLDRGQPGEAVDDQMEALDRLNEGANQLAQQLQEQGQGQQQAGGDGRGFGEGRDDQSADPFDRPTRSYGAIDGRETGVPDRSAIDRAREVLEELRRRAGEPTRPEIELDYLERLIEQF